jgi:deoxyribodipyrimidine photo-lyase
VKLGETYPMPIVDHKQARDRALEAYQEIKAA